MQQIETRSQLEREISNVRATIERCKANGRVIGAKAARVYLRELMNRRSTISN